MIGRLLFSVTDFGSMKDAFVILFVLYIFKAPGFQKICIC